MSKRCVMFTFSAEHIPEPIIYNLGQQYNVVTNILRANIAEDKGWIVLEIEGDEGNIEQGLAWVTSKGVRIDPIDTESKES
ncbi:MAG: FeS-binding protein [Chloroflexi bacterium]|nr:FeS-binding protein [Chloroflexota bacterium]